MVSVDSRKLTQDLRAAVADLETVNSWMGLLRFGGLGAAFFCFAALAWLSHSPFWFVFDTAVAGVFYAFWLICTHDAAHHTLTGWSLFDEGMSRLISWPLLWPYGAYAQLHRMHHGWNGVDLRDPERVQWTIAEYEQAHPIVKWYVRHQWVIDLLGWGGFGLIAKTVFNAIRWSDRVPSLHSMLLLDSVGILFMQICLLSIAIFNHCLGLYFLFWLILERVIGAIMQARDHLEHYGLWSRVPSHQLTQLYASRNLTTSSWIAWCMGGLNHHAVHHAFPNLPFNHLPEAFNRIQTVLAQYDLPPMSIGDGYVRETLHLGTQPSLIGEAQPHHAVGRYTMKAL